MYLVINFINWLESVLPPAFSFVSPTDFLFKVTYLCWGVSFINLLLLKGRLNRLGIQPRSLGGVIGIVFAPFLHGNWRHLISNTIFFLILGFLLLWQERPAFWAVTLTAIFAGGLLVWLFGRPKTHIGLSGLIFSYFGFILLSGFFEQNVQSVLLSLGVGIFLEKIVIIGLSPQDGVSWEGHLCGFLCGAAIAANHFWSILPWLESPVS